MRDSKPITDTFKIARQNIAKRILASPLSAYVGYPDEDDIDTRLAFLRHVTAGTDGGTSLFNVTFRRAGTNIELYVDSDNEWDVNPSVKLQDDEGNEYTRRSIRIRVSWPCHGASNPATALARIALYHDVSMLAAELHAEHSGERYMKLWRTSAQKIEQEAAKKERDQEAPLQDVPRSGAGWDPCPAVALEA